MSLNQEQGIYEEYPRSQFPGKVDNWANKQDIPVTMQPIVAQYQEAWDNMDIATIETLRSKYPQIMTYLFTADDINKVFDGLKATQQFFKDDVETYLKKIAQYKVGIVDEPSSEGEKKTSTYSAEKIEQLIGITVGEGITIPTSDWQTVEREDGFKYKWTYSNDKVLQTDRVMAWFDNASMIPASKASVSIDDNSDEHTISFISVKIPKKDLNIRLLKIYRE